MKLFKFNDRCEVEGCIYGAGQVVAFPDDFDFSDLPGEQVAEASVYVDHRAA